MREKLIKFRKHFVVAGGGLVLLGVGASALVSLSSQTSFCSSCHEIQPAATQWRISSHNDVNCVSCHTEPGFPGYLKVAFGGSRNALGHILADYETPIQADVDDTSCERCHNKAARPEVIVQASLRIAHSKHKDEKCADCHGRLVHTELVSDKPVGITPAHASLDCLVCHKPENCPHGEAKVDCVSCHSGVIPNHSLAVKRGMMPRESCISCHERKGLGSGEECRTCHFSPHGVDSDCSKCHSPERGWVETTFRHPITLQGKHAEVSCNKCHKGERLSGLRYQCSDCHLPPMNHFGVKCEQCHQAGLFWKK